MMRHRQHPSSCSVFEYLTILEIKLQKFGGHLIIIICI
ncbi:hypothetical protein TcasGA2_TC033239 [Tribolium castaneum]|uniref:Uncharacterized protein n=1 Tax=Tribolium castaneum TaxID=7070 RepID=A0A139WHH8_TRICA|nr:hypothetical protein TcasGA2_TC033239 [Tribolium castaneum]